jgi:hypothetical protein
MSEQTLPNWLMAWTSRCWLGGAAMPLGWGEDLVASDRLERLNLLRALRPTHNIYACCGGQIPN